MIYCHLDSLNKCNLCMRLKLEACQMIYYRELDSGERLSIIGMLNICMFDRYKAFAHGQMTP